MTGFGDQSRELDGLTNDHEHSYSCMRFLG